jgi:hypothetical protein
MSDSYYTYKQNLPFSTVLEIQDHVEGFTVIIPENTNERYCIQYEDSILCVHLDDERKNVISMFRYGVGKVEKMIKIISHFAKVTLFDEHELEIIAIQERADTILIVHFTENGKSLGSDFAKSLRKTPKFIDGCPFNGVLKDILAELNGYDVPNLWFESLEKMGGKDEFLQEFSSSWRHNHYNLFIYIEDEMIKIAIAHPKEGAKFVFMPSEENLNIYFDEQLHDTNGDLSGNRYSDEMDRDDLKLSIEACRAIVKGCKNGNKWIDGTYLEKLSEDGVLNRSDDVSLDALCLWQYEEFVVNRYQKGVDEFRMLNPGMKTFCDFFEKTLKRFYAFTVEIDQLTSH